MNPPVAARASQSTPSLRDRLKDASLLREQCYIDGAWTGTASRPVTNPVNGIELAKIPRKRVPTSCANGSTSSSPTVKTSH